MWQLQVKHSALAVRSIKGSWLITDVRGLGGTHSCALNIFCKHGLYLPCASLTVQRSGTLILADVLELEGGRTCCGCNVSVPICKHPPLLKERWLSF